MDELAVEKISEDSQKEDPFQVLIATMLSAQTKDVVARGLDALFPRRPHPADDERADAGPDQKRSPVSFY